MWKKKKKKRHTHTQTQKSILPVRKLCRTILTVAFFFFLMLFVAFLKSQDKLACVFLIQNHQRKQLHGPVWLAKGRSWPITSDFSDRKLGENLRKWLSGPTHKTELACAAAEENKHSFQVHKHNDSSVCACISAFPLFLTTLCTWKKRMCVQQVRASGIWQNTGVITRCDFNMC